MDEHLKGRIRGYSDSALVANFAAQCELDMGNGLLDYSDVTEAFRAEILRRMAGSGLAATQVPHT